MRNYNFKSTAKRSELKFTRKGKNITTVSTGATEHFDSLNLARQASRALQEANGGLGMGSLEVR